MRLKRFFTDMVERLSRYKNKTEFEFRLLNASTSKISTNDTVKHIFWNFLQLNLTVMRNQGK